LPAGESTNTQWALEGTEALVDGVKMHVVDSWAHITEDAGDALKHRSALEDRWLVVFLFSLGRTCEGDGEEPPEKKIW
jgi:hypothetical protein